MEEQFYLIYPLLFLVPQLQSMARLRWLVGAGAIGSFALSAWLAQRAPAFQFYNLPARAWELGVGCFVACIEPRFLRQPTRRESFAFAGAALIGMAIAFRAGIPPLLSQAFACAGAGMILAAGSQGSSKIGGMLSFGPIVGLGLVSYSVYLWHWPLLVFGKYTSLISPASAVVLAIVLGVLSWRFIEQPFRKAWPTRRNLALLSFAACAAVVCISYATAAFHGFPDRIPAETARLLEDTKRQEQTYCRKIGPGSERCAIGQKSAAPTVFVWGDSHGQALGSGFNAAAIATHQSGILQFTQGCPPLVDVERLGHYTSCSNSAARTIEEIRQNSTIREVVMVAHWNEYMLNSSGIFYGRSAQQPLDPNTFYSNLHRTIAQISASGRRITVLVDMPDYEWDIPRMVYATSRLGIKPIKAPNRRDFDMKNSAMLVILDKISKEIPIHIVSLGPYLCHPDCEYMLQGRIAYADPHHVSDFAALHQFAPIIAKVVFATTP